MTKRLYVFDLDDTLMWNSYTYGLALGDFYIFLLNLWNKRIPSLGSVASFSEEIDATLGKEINPKTGEIYGFSMERFPTSLVLTYRHLCGMGFGKYSKEIAGQVYKIGMTAFDEKHYKETGFVADAEAVLDEIIFEDNSYMVLLTKGDKRVQEPKIKALGLSDFFDEYLIEDDKTEDTFKNIKKKYNAKENYAIGNSYYSDIQPAISVGFMGIYIPCYTWKVERLPNVYPRKLVTTLSDMYEFLDFLST